MFDPSTTPDVPPPSRTSMSAAASSRYVYLLTRLRNKQITMEEATELFSIQQTMIRASARLPPPPPITDTGEPAGPVPAATMGLPSQDDALWVTMLAMGAGAGVLAALFKRARDGPITHSSSASNPPTGANGRSG